MPTGASVASHTCPHHHLIKLPFLVDLLFIGDSDFQFQEIVNHFYSSHMIEDLELLEYIFVLLIVIFPNKSKAMNFSNDIKKNQIYSHMYLFQLGKFIFLICSVMICLQCLQTFAPLASNLLHYKRV